MNTTDNGTLTKKSKMIQWLIIKIGDLIILNVFLFPIAFTFGVDHFLKIEENVIHSAESEIIYLPILILGFFIGAFLTFWIGRAYQWFLRIFFPTYSHF